MTTSKLLRSVFNLGHEDVATSQDPRFCIEVEALLSQFLSSDDATWCQPGDREIAVAAVKRSPADAVLYLPPYNCALVSRTAIGCCNEQTTIQLVFT
jgi:hypothetical protein